MFAYRGRQVSAEELAERACAIEIERCGKPIGKQDQYAAALGGIRDLRFGPGDTVVADQVALDPAAQMELQQQIMLFYTGITRSADPILAEQNSKGPRSPCRTWTNYVTWPGSRLNACAAETSTGLRQGDAGKLGG